MRPLSKFNVKARRSMRIIRVSEYMIPWLGGILANEYHVCKELALLGHEVSLFTSDIVPSRYIPRIKSDRSEEVDGFRVVRSTAVMNLGGDMPIMPDLMFKMKNVDADIIHAHEYYNYTSLMAYLVAKKKGISFTYTQDRYYWIKRKVWRLPFWLGNKTLFKFVREAPEIVTAFSMAASEFLAGQGYPSEKISVIPIGVEVSRFRPFKDYWFREYLGIGEENPIILTVARLHRSKNLDGLLRAMFQVKEEVNDAKLVIIGRGPREEALKTLAMSLRLTEDVFFISELIPLEKMPSVYNACDVFVLPSLYEPFGVAVLEAMACAKPVVVSDVGGMGDTVVDTRTGFKIPIDSGEKFVSLLSTRIIKLLNDRRLRGTMGISARERTESLYDWKVIAKSYDAFYKRLKED